MLTKAFVVGNGYMKWCQNPRCEAVVMVEGQPTANVEEKDAKEGKSTDKKDEDKKSTSEATPQIITCSMCQFAFCTGW
jgi:hypothetical protein